MRLQLLCTAWHRMHFSYCNEAELMFTPTAVEHLLLDCNTPQCLGAPGSSKATPPACPVCISNEHVVPAAAAVLGRILELKDYTTICSSAPSEVLALIMLRK